MCGPHSPEAATYCNRLPCLFSRLSPEERAHVEAQLDVLMTTYDQLLESSTQQLQQLEQQLAKEEERKVDGLKGWGETRKIYLSNTCSA